MLVQHPSRRKGGKAGPAVLDKVGKRANYELI